MDPDLSVIIPVYNGEKTIKACIESVLSQSMTNIEIIVINDGSRDNTVKILNSLDDPRIKIITIPNSGQGIARNKGIEAAGGKYIGFVDADDTIDRHMYETMYYLAKKHSAEMVQCAINDIRGSTVTKRPNMESIAVKITDTAAYADSYFYKLKHTNEVCNKIFSKCFLDKSGIRFDDTRKVYSEDLKLNIDILPYLTCVCFTNEAFYNYNIHTDGHCLKDPILRLEGIYNLYSKSIDNIKNIRLKRCIQSMAVINLLSYSVSLSDNERVKKIIISKSIKKYMFSSLLYKGTITHGALMLALIILPFKMKKMLIKKYYTFD